MPYDPRRFRGGGGQYAGGYALGQALGGVVGGPGSSGWFGFGDVDMNYTPPYASAYTPEGIPAPNAIDVRPTFEARLEHPYLDAFLNFGRGARRKQAYEDAFNASVFEHDLGQWDYRNQQRAAAAADAARRKAETDEAIRLENARTNEELNRQKKLHPGALDYQGKLMQQEIYKQGMLHNINEFGAVPGLPNFNITTPAQNAAIERLVQQRVIDQEGLVGLNQAKTRQAMEVLKGREGADLIISDLNAERDYYLADIERQGAEEWREWQRNNPNATAEDRDAKLSEIKARARLAWMYKVGPGETAVEMIPGGGGTRIIGSGKEEVGQGFYEDKDKTGKTITRITPQTSKTIPGTVTPSQEDISLRIQRQKAAEEATRRIQEAREAAGGSQILTNPPPGAALSPGAVTNPPPAGVTGATNPPSVLPDTNTVANAIRQQAAKETNVNPGLTLSTNPPAGVNNLITNNPYRSTLTNPPNAGLQFGTNAASTNVGGISATNPPSAVGIRRQPAPETNLMGAIRRALSRNPAFIHDETTNNPANASPFPLTNRNTSATSGVPGITNLNRQLNTNAQATAMQPNTNATTAPATGQPYNTNAMVIPDEVVENSTAVTNQPAYEDIPPDEGDEIRRYNANKQKADAERKKAVEQVKAGVKVPTRTGTLKGNEKMRADEEEKKIKAGEEIAGGNTEGFGVEGTKQALKKMTPAQRRTYIEIHPELSNLPTKEKEELIRTGIIPPNPPLWKFF